MKFVVKRKRGGAKGCWVEMGTCVVNTDDGTGTLYVNAIDANWQLFEIKGGKGRTVPDVPDAPDNF